MKQVHVTGYDFDSLPGHVRVYGRGKGSGLRVAVQRAVADALVNSPVLRRKSIGSFKLAVVVENGNPVTLPKEKN